MEIAPLHVRVGGLGGYVDSLVLWKCTILSPPAAIASIGLVQVEILLESFMQNKHLILKVSLPG